MMRARQHIAPVVAVFAGLCAVAPSVVADDVCAVPDMVTETSDAAEIRCALGAAAGLAQARGLSVVEMAPEAPVEGARFAINFEFGSAAITPASQALLARVAEVIAADDTLRGAAYLIDGHTDAVGTDADNFALGQARAAATAALLGQVDFALAIRTRSFGESRLIDATDPEAARNRRVEITPVARSD